MNKLAFSERLASLRAQKGISARDMSLSLGQSAGYINNIENGANYPSMSLFFLICDYLEVSPAEFFSVEYRSPGKTHELIQACKHLNEKQIDNLISLAKDLK